jgi:hypothetical protein
VDEPAIVVEDLRVRRGGQEVLRGIGCAVRRGAARLLRHRRDDRVAGAPCLRRVG